MLLLVLVMYNYVKRAFTYISSLMMISLKVELLFQRWVSANTLPSILAFLI